MTNNQLTKEWLQQTIAELESVRDEIPFGIDTNSELELAAFKMALAAMYSEPVVPVVDSDDNFYSWFGREWQDNYQHNQYTTAAKQMLGVMAESAWKAGRRAAMLATAQPAPVVQLPQVEQIEQFGDGWSSYYQDYYLAEDVRSALTTAGVKWSDAMLQAGDAVRDLSTPVDPQVAEYEQNVMQAVNSPVIPDTWIPVSERIPGDEQEVLTINRMGHRFVSFFDKHSGLFFDRLDAPSACCIEHVLVTHWMELPAAPQEVK